MYYTSETDRTKGLRCAQRYVNVLIEFCKRIIFTDERKFGIFDSDE